MFKVNKNTRTTNFTPFSSISIADFEQVNVSWVFVWLVIVKGGNITQSYR